ncbi:MAG: hydratase [Hyphomicrobiales bacterium]|nr:hydratase [Hyphomicrobiales bacterium]
MNIDSAVVASKVYNSLRSASQTDPFTDSLPDFDETQAYQVTAALRDLRSASGERPVGRKIGFTNRTIWEEYGVYAPIWGDIYDATVFDTDAQAHGALSLAGLCEPRIEPEIVFGLAGPISPGMSDTEVLAALDWIAHGFEIVQSIYPGWKFRIADTIACGGLHGRMIIGPRQPASRWRPDELAIALQRFSIELACNSTQADSGGGGNVLDSPVNALRHLAQVLAADPANPPLAAGEIVTTGTLTRAFPVAPGETWTTALRGLDLPGLTVRFV